MLSPLIDIFRYIKMFHKYLGNRIFLIFLFALFAALAEGVGILLLFPLFESLDSLGVDEEVGTGINFFIKELIISLGLTDSTSNILGLIAITFLLKGMLTWIALAFNAYLFGQLLRELKSRLFDQYSLMNYGYYSSKDTGHFTNLINEQPSRAIDAFKQLTILVGQTINTIVLIGLAFSIAWIFGLLALCIGVLLLLIFMSLNSYVRKLSRYTASEAGNLNRWLIQTLHAFKYLTATAQTHILRANVVGSIGRLTDFAIRQGIASALTKSVREPIAVIFIVLILYFQLEVNGQPFEPIMVALVLFYRALNSTIAVQSGFQGTFQFIGSMELVDQEIVNLTLNQVDAGSNDISHLGKGIEFEEVTFRYENQEKDVIDRVSLSIPVNKSIALVGESGAGKSTLVDLIALMIEPVEGKILVDGVPSNLINKESWRRQIGYVSQETVIFDDTIANNISMWANDRSGDDMFDRIKDAASQANILEFVESLPLGFDTLVGDRGVLLSGGQRQRLFVARELFRKPRLLILDEATSALDSASEKEIQNSIDELSGKTTVIIIAHRLSTIKNVDLIYVLKDGALKESGTYKELVSDSSTSFSKLVSMQSLGK